jgi:hypothetical protein
MHEERHKTTERQKEIKTKRQKDRKKEIHTYRQMDGQADGDTDRLTYRQTDE